MIRLLMALSMALFASVTPAFAQGQPQITVIARDRGGTYAEAATKGAPQALQVADRWHLIHNLVEVIEEFICITLGIACEGQKARFVILNAMGKQVIGQFTPRDRWMARQFHFRTQIVSNFRPTAYQELTAPGYFLTSSHLRVRADLRTESQTYWVSRASRKSGRARFFLPRESMKSAT